jgi:DNA repair exonuclease SbcCD nuclease subunit
MTMLMKFLVLSDLHIGHNLNNFDVLLQGFNKFVVPELSDTQIVFITGDYFHTSLTLNNVEAQQAFFFLSKLMELADIHKFKIRILQGTYSHDRDQVKRLLPLLTGWNADIQYIDKCYIENLYGSTFLYLPDNPVYQNMEELLIQLQHYKVSVDHPVDFIMSHGLYDFYKYQGNLPCYNLEFLSSIVKHWICSGHIHTHRIYGKYISIGSFTRFRHGEEEDKGYVILQNVDNSWVPTFVVNECTIKFLTFALDNLTSNKLVESYKKLLQRYFTETEEAHVRIILKDINQAKNLQTYTANAYPNLKFTYKPIKKSLFQTSFNLSTDRKVAQDLSNLHSLLNHMTEYFKNFNIPVNFNLKERMQVLNDIVQSKYAGTK